tara:strand:- start:241 stop:345 length:105 start_codon:yes stop_codon:yes gene_type:complete
MARRQRTKNLLLPKRGNFGRRRRKRLPEESREIP